MEATGGTFIPAGYKSAASALPMTPDRSATPSPPGSPSNKGEYASCKEFSRGIFASGSRFMAAVKTEDGHTRFLGKHDSRTDACHAVQDYLRSINRIRPKQMFHYY